MAAGFAGYLEKPISVRTSRIRCAVTAVEPKLDRARRHMTAPGDSRSETCTTRWCCPAYATPPAPDRRDHLCRCWGRSRSISVSIAQILISVVTCAVLEVAIVLRRQRAFVWPASALLTGNGVAFILRVPGTEPGDWWSTNGWWIFAGTAAVSLLSKYLIRFRGAHVFNPSNFGLVLCFLLLGPDRADPLDFWWGPMSPALALALAIIVVGGFAILSRLRLLAWRSRSGSSS